ARTGTAGRARLPRTSLGRRGRALPPDRREHEAKAAHMNAPLQLSFAVDCAPDHAFDVWTTRIGMWWPPDHTMSGDPDTVAIEGHVGGRIFERTRARAETDWGGVTRVC